MSDIATALRRASRRPLRGASGIVSEPPISGQTMDCSAGGLYSSVGAAVLKGNNTGWVRWAALRLKSIPTVNDYFWTYRNSGTTQGWALRFTSAGVADGFMFDGGGGLNAPTGYTLTADDVGKIHLVHLRYDGSLLYFSFDGNYIGFASPGATYSTPDASQTLSIGGLSGFASCQHAEILAVGGSDASPDLAETCADHYEATLAAGTGVAMGTTGEHWWNVDSAADLPVSWTDETATASLTKSGTITVNDPTFTMLGLAHGTRGQTAASRYFTRAAGTTLLDGSSSMTICLTGAAVQRSATAWTSGNNYVADKAAAGVTQGWGLRLLNTGAPTIRGEVANGSGVLTATNSANTAGIAINDLITVAVTLGSNQLIIYLNGSAVGSPVTCTGYTAPGAGIASFIHTFGSLYNRDFSVFGFGFDGANTATPAQVAAWHAACDASNQGFVPMGLPAEVAWSMRDGDGGAATWPDTTATYNWTRVGSLRDDHIRAVWK